MPVFRRDGGGRGQSALVWVSLPMGVLEGGEGVAGVC